MKQEAENEWIFEANFESCRPFIRKLDSRLMVPTPVVVELMAQAWAFVCHHAIRDCKSRDLIKEVYVASVKELTLVKDYFPLEAKCSCSIASMGHSPNASLITGTLTVSGSIFATATILICS
jgi:hypothetical protein